MRDQRALVFTLWEMRAVLEALTRAQERLKKIAALADDDDVIAAVGTECCTWST